MYSLSRIYNICQQISFEHICLTEAQASVIHRLEDSVGVIIRGGCDFNEIHIVFEPVYEMLQGITSKCPWKIRFDFIIAGYNVIYGLRTAIGVERLIVEKGF